MRKTHIVGNWKMNQSLAEIETFFNELGELSDINCAAWIAPQGMHLPILLEKKLEGFAVGAQNCCEQDSGAFTGELSPKSLKDLGAHFVILGHSERRAIYKEQNALLNKKLHKALENQLVAIFCVGETLEEREAGSVEAVLKVQLTEGLKGLTDSHIGKVIIAYEPVWAIGTGKVATPEQAQEVHAYIRKELANISGFKPESTPILYGGSVKPANVEGLLTNEDIDGALVGGASLTGTSFKELCQNSK
ncbi:triose-phosphate isomerase [Halobacteriovorax marinus]|uniref:Triosephosphate isomerase n=1 Tax=Halobacteriovorax marinus TaxID=97084 RepID=A0A1Y5F5S2_9BACT|nr:triose-phosphate isomerase [Halobacteriovorax marinus]